MSFELSEKIYVHSMRHVNWGAGDYMGMLYRECVEPHSLEGASGWIFKMRFRHYKDDKVWNSEDEKNWYEVKTSADNLDEEFDKLMDTLETLETGALAILGNELETTMVECFGDEEKLFKIFNELGFIHMFPGESLN